MSWIAPKVELLHLEPRAVGASLTPTAAAAAVVSSSRRASIMSLAAPTPSYGSCARIANRSRRASITSPPPAPTPTSAPSTSSSWSSPSSSSWVPRTGIVGLQGGARTLSFATQIIIKVCVEARRPHCSFVYEGVSEREQYHAVFMSEMNRSVTLFFESRSYFLCLGELNGNYCAEAARVLNGLQRGSFGSVVMLFVPFDAPSLLTQRTSLKAA